MCFSNSLPNHDFKWSPNSSELLVSIPFCWVPFKSSSWELSTRTLQLWVWVLESNIATQYQFCKVVMWPWSDQSQQRMSSRHCTNIVEEVSQTRPRQACVSLTCPRQYQDISNLHICLDLPPGLCRHIKSCDVLGVLGMSWPKVLEGLACVTPA